MSETTLENLSDHKKKNCQASEVMDIKLTVVITL